MLPECFWRICFPIGCDFDIAHDIVMADATKFWPITLARLVIGWFFLKGAGPRPDLGLFDLGQKLALRARFHGPFVFSGKISIDTLDTNEGKKAESKSNSH